MDPKEQEIEQLRKLSYAMAMNMMKNHDDADDVAQNTMFQFISAAEVQNAEAWTKKVTHHLVMEKFRDQKKNLNIHQKASIVEDNEDETTRKKRELLEINHITQEQVKRYLTAPERKIYKEFLALDFGIKKYADKYKVTYNVAQKRLEMIRRNLKAAYLREKGYMLTSTLTIKQWNTVYSMIRRNFLNKDNVPFPIDEFLTFCFMKKIDHQLIFVVGKNEGIPVFFIIKGIFLRSHFKIQEIFAPKQVREISAEELAIIRSRSTFNTIV